MLEHALKYLEMGFNVMPVKPDKKPYLMTWAEYQKKRVTETSIEKWWSTWPDANIAIITGEISNLLVVDADSEQGLVEIDKIDPTLKPTVKTPNGWHYYFRHDGKTGNATRFLPDCDIRGQGGYVLAPPSNNGNGRAYEFLTDIDNLEIIPSGLQSIINSSFKHDVTNGGVTTALHDVTNCYISFEKGKRDESIFHVANCLVKGGMSKQDIEYCLKKLALTCNPPFPEKEIQIKINSAIKRASTKDKNIHQEIKDLILLQSGYIRVTDCYSALQVVTKQEKLAVRQAIYRLSKDGLLEPTGKNAGEYRIVDESAEPIDWKNSKENWANIYLPWKLNDIVDIPEGGIILLMGNPGAGKTAACINVARYNMRKKWKVHYLSSEISEGAFKKRAQAYKDVLLKDWNVDFYYDSPIVDTIKGGKRNLYIIDYLEIYDNFWQIGKTMSDIYKKLSGGVALIAIQKRPGSEIGLGGQFTQFKPALTLALDWQKVTLIKARDVKESHMEKYGTPNKKEYHFKLIENRTKYTEERWWTHPFKEGKNG